MVALAGVERLELPTPGFGDRCSNQIELHSYVWSRAAIEADKSQTTPAYRWATQPYSSLEDPVEPCRLLAAILIVDFWVLGL